MPTPYALLPSMAIRAGAPPPGAYPSYRVRIRPTGRVRRAPPLTRSGVGRGAGGIERMDSQPHDSRRTHHGSGGALGSAAGQPARQQWRAGRAQGPVSCFFVLAARRGHAAGRWCASAQWECAQVRCSAHHHPCIARACPRVSFSPADALGCLLAGSFPSRAAGEGGGRGVRRESALAPFIPGRSKTLLDRQATFLLFPSWTGPGASGPAW